MWRWAQNIYIYTLNNNLINTNLIKRKNKVKSKHYLLIKLSMLYNAVKTGHNNKYHKTHLSPCNICFDDYPILSNHTAVSPQHTHAPVCRYCPPPPRVTILLADYAVFHLPVLKTSGLCFARFLTTACSQTCTCPQACFLNTTEWLQYISN